MSKEKEKSGSFIQRIKKNLKDRFTGTIHYKKDKGDKGDAGKIADTILEAKKTNATKKYDKAIDAGYKYFGKTRPVLPELTYQEELQMQKEMGPGLFTHGEKLKKIKQIIKNRKEGIPPAPMEGDSTKIHE